MEVNVLYSIGIRCYTEMILKRLGLVRFSSVFGSMNTRSYDNIIQCLDTHCKILFDEENLIYTKNIPSMDELNTIHGFRTLHKIFDDVNNYHSATIAHHDLSNEEHKKHFTRALQRLEYIKEKNIPILFVHISISTDYDNTNENPELIESIRRFGISNMKVLSILKTTSISEPERVHISDFQIIYKIPTYGFKDPRDDPLIHEIIQRHFKVDTLMTIQELENGI